MVLFSFVLFSKEDKELNCPGNNKVVSIEKKNQQPNHRKSKAL